jgi:hypothetical protein
MATHAPARRRPTHRRPSSRTRRRPGFWHGLRHATHTDHLRARVGGAAGRALVRRINRHRARRGKPPIPDRGGDWYILPEHVRPMRPSRPSRPSPVGLASVKTPKPTAAPQAGTAPKTPRVAGQPKAKTASTPPPKATTPAKTPVPRRVVTRIIKGAPAATTQGQAKAQGQPPVFSGPYVKASSGKASQRKVKPGTISVTSSGISGPGNQGAGAGIGAPAYGTGGETGDGDHMLSPQHVQTNGDTTMSTMPGVEALSEAPETDAEYVAALRGLAGEVAGFGDRIEEIQASLLEHVGMDQAALGAYTAMAEHANGLAEATNQAVTDFLNTYAGVIETAQSGVKIPGGEGRFFTGDVA